MNASNVNTSYKTLNELQNTKDPIHLEINLKIELLDACIYEFKEFVCIHSIFLKNSFLSILIFPIYVQCDTNYVEYS